MIKLHEYIKPLEAVISPLSAFFTGTTLTCMGYALLTSTLSVQMNLHHVPTAEIGLILSLYYAGYILASVTASKIINKVGHIRAFSAYISIFSAIISNSLRLLVSSEIWRFILFCCACILEINGASSS